MENIRLLRKLYLLLPGVVQASGFALKATPDTSFYELRPTRQMVSWFKQINKIFLPRNQNTWFSKKPILKNPVAHTIPLH